MKKMKNVKTYSPTTKGYGELVLDDNILADFSRNVAMEYLPQYYRKETEENKIKGYHSLVGVANLAGFKIRVYQTERNGDIILKNRFPSYRDYNFYTKLFEDFKTEIGNIEYNPNDEHGLCDESVKIANIVFKYKDIIAMKVKRKSLYEKVRLFISNNYDKI